MKQRIFPKEIIRFSVENHHFRFSKQSKIIYQLVLGSILVALVALPYIEVDITVQSPGIIRSQIEPTNIQAPVTGQVQRISIRENMKVNVGDTLMTLVPEKIDDQLSMIKSRMGTYGSYISDLEHLINGRGQAVKSDLLRSSYTEYHQKIVEFDIQIQNARKEHQRTKMLFDKAVVSAAEFEKVELQLNQLIKEKESYISQRQSAWNQQLFQYKTEYQTLTDSRDQLRFEQRFYVVLAPSDGFITNFTGIKAGSFIFPNQVIATIAPVDSLIVECMVSPNDIGYLRTGQSANFQIDAYNYNLWGLASGKVIDISNQPFQQENAIVFKVKCKLNESSLKLKNGYKGKLKNGLTLTSRFKVTRRSLFDLLFDQADDWLNPKLQNPRRVVVK